MASIFEYSAFGQQLRKMRHCLGAKVAPNKKTLTPTLPAIRIGKIYF